MRERQLRRSIRLNCEDNPKEVVQEPSRLFTFCQVNTCPVSALLQGERYLPIKNQNNYSQNYEQIQ